MIYKTVNILAEVTEIFNFNNWIKISIVKKKKNNTYGQQVKTDLIWLQLPVFLCSFIYIFALEYHVKQVGVK